MTWTAYQVTFRLLSPLHVGWRKLGNLQQTRPYVTGRSLWGAFTARLTREAGGNNYVDIGKEVDKQLTFTYFYPSTQSNGVSLWPWSNWDEFAWTFLGSYASTALENARNAKAGSLHETEFIAPCTREGQQVYLVGYIFEQDNCKLNWQGILDKLQLGGERGYGWGRVRSEGKPKQVPNNECFGYKLIPNSAHPLLSAQKATKLLAHTIAKDDKEARGVAIEPLVGRETKEASGFGKDHSKAEICWIPGGSVSEGETFQIEARGIWEKLSGTAVHLPDDLAAS